MNKLLLPLLIKLRVVKERTLGNMDSLKLSDVDNFVSIEGELPNINKILHDATCPNCGSNSVLNNVFPLTVLDGKTLKECQNCHERCYK